MRVMLWWLLPSCGCCISVTVEPDTSGHQMRLPSTDKWLTCWRLETYVLMLTFFQSNGLHLSIGCLDARSPLPLKLPSLTGLPSILLDKIRARKPFSGILLPFAHNIDLLVLFSYSQRSIKMTLGLLMPACQTSSLSTKLREQVQRGRP